MVAEEKGGEVFSWTTIANTPVSVRMYRCNFYLVVGWLA